jgi:hypothetical protein
MKILKGQTTHLFEMTKSGSKESMASGQNQGCHPLPSYTGFNYTGSVTFNGVDMSPFLSELS